MPEDELREPDELTPEMLDPPEQEQPAQGESTPEVLDVPEPPPLPPEETPQPASPPQIVSAPEHLEMAVADARLGFDDTSMGAGTEKREEEVTSGGDSEVATILKEGLGILKAIQTELETMNEKLDGINRWA